ncbi:dTDP-4-dehydrorhamnose reductase [Neisseria leonii]|uniref:dTDP-4-dehydrorhamnose reductase n=1 Tax=Neisseria leonii TaxID=2995413 RepID=UPI00237A0DD0|nr:dTDP-4-dehydrorhamnose reductase [Neisseria sp. 3986]MDD9325022.1 dTDP-4-dehydrorhamnose reductase [Neisseria sp. 3986]
MRILITGAKGQLGRSIKARLPEHWELIATDSKTLDITNQEVAASMVKNFHPDVVVNAAAYTSFSGSQIDIDRTFAINAYGARNLAQAARGVGAKFIHLSSDYVFSGHSRIPYLETDAPAPLSSYGQSKLSGELLALAAHPDTLLIRTSWMFSEYGNNSVAVLLKQAAAQQELSLVDNQAACPTYAGDVADLIIGLLGRTELPGGILHYCGDKALSAYKFAQTVFHHEAERNPDFTAPALRAITLDETDPSAKRPQYSALNCDRARELGFAPSDWQASLPAVLAALAEQTPD